jgi:hypothetical protein
MNVVHTGSPFRDALPLWLYGPNLAAPLLRPGPFLVRQDATIPIDAGDSDFRLMGNEDRASQRNGGGTPPSTSSSTSHPRPRLDRLQRAVWTNPVHHLKLSFDGFARASDRRVSGWLQTGRTYRD